MEQSIDDGFHAYALGEGGSGSRAGGVLAGVLGPGVELQGNVQGLGGLEDPLHPDSPDHVHGRGVKGEAVFGVDDLPDGVG
jgi:hypothetical protein